MNCTKISVRNFRNIEQAEVSFSPEVNVLVGANAQGKTNLLEALFYPSAGRSFRGAHMNEMIRFGQPFAELTLDYHDSCRSQTIGVKIFRDRQKQIEKNGMRIDKLSEMVGSFRSVLFCPEHLSLIKDGPAGRRGYLDLAISRLYPMYLYSLQQYNYLLRQRNALLKTAYTNRGVFDATIELWSMRLAHEAAKISAARLSFIKRISGHISDCFTEMTGEAEIPTVYYHGSSGQDSEAYADKDLTEQTYFRLLMSSHEKEIAMGSTLWGIHKDDLDIRLNGKSAKIYGSQGQQRSLALAMKLAEGEITKEEFKDYPVFLFDDVLSELDGSRREYLLHKIEGKQVIMTGCDPNLLSESIGVRRILVNNGTYQNESI